MAKKEDLCSALITFGLLAIYLVMFKFKYLDLTAPFTINLLNFNLARFALALLFLAGLACLISRNIDITKIKTRKLLLFLFVFAFLLSALFWNSPQINPDAARYFTYAKDFGNFEERPISFSSDMPLMPLVYNFLFRIFGESMLVFNIAMSVIYASIVVLVFLISKKLFDKDIGLYSSVIFISFPGILIQTGLFLVDIPLTLLVALSVYLGIVASEKNRLHLFVLMFLSIIAALLTKVHAFLFLMPALILILNIKNKKTLRIIIFSVISIVLIAALAVYLMFKDAIGYIWGSFLAEFSAVNPGISLLSFLFQLGPCALLMFLGPFFMNKKEKILLYSWLLPPMLLITFKFLPLDSFRYLVAATPAVAIIAGNVISKIRQKDTASFIILIIIFSSLIISLVGFLPLMKSCGDNNLIKAAGYLDEIDSVKTIAVYTASAHVEEAFFKMYHLEPLAAIFDLYSKKEIVYCCNLGEKEGFVNDWTRDYKLPIAYLNETKLSKADAAILIADEQKEYSISNMSLVKEFTEGNRTIMPTKIYVYLRES